MRLLRTLILTVAGLATLAGEAQACSCVTPGDPRKEIRDARAAVFGEVVRVRRGDEGAPGIVRVRLRVLRDYKDNLGRVVRLRTADQSAACGLGVRRGQRIGLLLERFGGRWSAGLCGVRSRKHLEQGVASGATFPAARRAAPVCQSAARAAPAAP